MPCPNKTYEKKGLLGSPHPQNNLKDSIQETEQQIRCALCDVLHIMFFTWTTGSPKFGNQFLKNASSWMLKVVGHLDIVNKL